MITGAFADLAVGDTFAYRDTAVTVLGEETTYTDRFGRTMYQRWAKRADTGAEGWLPYGPGGRFAVDSKQPT